MIGVRNKDKDYQMILEQLDTATNGIRIKPGTLSQNEALGGTEYIASGDKDTIRIVNEYNEHAHIMLLGENKTSRIHLNSRLNSVDVSGFYVGEKGNYYISQEYGTKIIKKGKTYEEIEQEVEKEMPNALYSDKGIEVSRRWDKESKDVTTTFCKAKIFFYDVESIGCLKNPEVANHPDIGYVNHCFQQIGIQPSQMIEFEVGSQQEMVSLINDFYKNPEKYIQMITTDKEQTL